MNRRNWKHKKLTDFNILFKQFYACRLLNWAIKRNLYRNKHFWFVGIKKKLICIIIIIFFLTGEWSKMRTSNALSTTKCLSRNKANHTFFKVISQSYRFTQNQSINCLVKCCSRSSMSKKKWRRKLGCRQKIELICLANDCYR